MARGRGAHATGAMRATGIACAGVATAVALAGCSGLSVSRAGDTVSSGPSASPAPSGSASSAPSPTKTVPPDATLADLGGVVVPAYCQQPPVTLPPSPAPSAERSGTTSSDRSSSPSDRASSADRPSPSSSSDGASEATSSGRSSSGDASSSANGSRGHGEIVAGGPGAPVLADVDGDGAKEVVAQWRCDAGGTTWPTMLLVVRHGGELLGTVKLGDIARTEHASVTGWQPSGTGLVVDWSAYEGAGFDKRPYENLLTLSGSTVRFAATDRGKALGQTTIVDLPGPSAFTTPTGRVACRMDGASVACAVTRPTWKPDSNAAPGCGDADAMRLADGSAAYDCLGLAPFRAAADDRSPRWQRQSDPTIRTDVGEAPALAYGRTLTTGQATCTVAVTGVTCTDTNTGRGFTVSTETARTF